jgi:hypothetical protein
MDSLEELDVEAIVEARWLKLCGRWGRRSR